MGRLYSNSINIMKTLELHKKDIFSNSVVVFFCGKCTNEARQTRLRIIQNAFCKVFLFIINSMSYSASVIILVVSRNKLLWLSIRVCRKKDAWVRLPSNPLQKGSSQLTTSSPVLSLFLADAFQRLPFSCLIPSPALPLSDALSPQFPLALNPWRHPCNFHLFYTY